MSRLLHVALSPDYLRYYFNRILRHIFSIYRWVVMIRPLAVVPAQRVFQLRGGEFVSFREATIKDLPALIDSYPSEFSSHMPLEMVRDVLTGRSSRKIPCFLALNAVGELCGATWCPPYRGEVLRKAGISDDRVFEMMNTFVISQYRGQGVGGALRHFALNEMARRGYTSVISFVWYSRQESLKMNFATGSRLLAEKRQITILGWRRIDYSHRINLSKLPLSEKPHVLVLGETATNRRAIRDLFRAWGISARSLRIPRENRAGRTTSPIIFCCDQESRNRIMEKADSQHFVPRMLLQSWEEAEPLPGLPYADRHRESRQSFVDQLCAAEKQSVGVAGLLYLTAIGKGELIRLWGNPG